MSARKSVNDHQQRISREAESLVLAGLSILALHVPGEKLGKGREATGKEPRGRGWSKVDDVEAENKRVLNELRTRESNLGVRLGTPSRGTVDVDLDCVEATMLAESWLPPTTWIFGRDSAPKSHYVYSWDEWAGERDKEYKTRKFYDVSDGGLKSVLLEIRSTGSQTVFPGSRHHSGEIVRWQSTQDRKSSPGTTAGEESEWNLERSCEFVAAGTMLARHWPESTYHDGCLALAGGLVRAGWDIELTKQFVLGVGAVVGMRNLDDRERVIEDTYRKFEEGENVVGWPTAIGVFGEEVIKRVRDWLHISKDLVAEQGELELSDEIPWRMFPDVKTKEVDGERVISGLKGTYDNLEVVLQAYGIEVMYDVILRARYFKMRGDTEWRRMDNGFRTLVDTLAARNGLPRMNIPNQIDKVADKNRVNPVVEYLESVEWDGKDHIGQLCKGIKIVGGRHERRWLKKLLGKWFIQTAAAADGGKRTPNVEALNKFESVLVMLGGQGTQKTSWIIKLVPEHLRRYVKTALHVNPADRDSLKQATTCWIGEIGELDATFRKADISQLKAFLSQEYDEYRVPYGVDAEVYPRLTSFGASVNGFGFLQDSTGNRRFWVVEVLEIEHYENMDQVWAQAWAAYLRGEQWWLDLEEDQQLHEIQRAHTAIEMDPVYAAMHMAFPDLGASVKKDEWLTIQQIAERAGLVYGLELVDMKMARKIAGFMREYSRSYRGQKIEMRPRNKLHFAVPKKALKQAKK